MPFSNELLAAAGVTPESTQGTPPPYLNNDVEKKLNINQEPPKSLKELAQNRALKGLEKGMSLHTNNEQIKPYTYNAGSDSQSFYKRYHSFGQETFDKIGFSPFKNNDVAFNAQTSFLDRAQRSFVHGFLPLAGRGFVSGPKSLVRMLEGDFGDDPEDAAKYAEAAAIAQDTAGGVGSFFNNSLMNFGYTFGIIGEALAEEAAATIITAPMGGVGGFINLPNLGAKIMRGARAIKGFETVTDAAAGLNKAINSLTNINNARKFFNADRIESALATRGGKVANFFNPAENLLETGLEIAKNTKQLQGWNKFQNATFKTAGALYRDVRNINMALSEARLEGGFTRNDTYKQLVDEYKGKHQGQAPPQNVKDAMMAKADEASKATMLANTLLIYASNKVTFNNVMNPKSGLAKMLSKKVAEVQKMAGQSTVREFTKQTLKSGKELLTPKLTTVKGAWATAKKQGLQKTVKAAIGYTKANLMEGAQEVLQEVIADTSKNYHLQSFYSQPVGHYMYTEAQRKAIEDKSFGDILGEAFSKQASWQGLETFASGFVMGAFASPLNRAIPFAQESYMRVFKKDEYKAHRDKIDKYVEKMTKSVNDTFAKNPLEFLNSKVFSLGTQTELANVIDAGDTKIERDAKEEATIKSVTDLIKMNSLDTWTDYMESLKELTTEEYAEAASISVEQAQGHVEKLDKVIGRAKEIEKTYNEYNKKFPNPIDLGDYKKGTTDYEKAEVYYNAWEEAKKNVVFYHENYKDTVARMQKIYQSIGKEELLGKIDPNRVQALLKDDRLKGEIQILESEVQGLKGMTDSVSKRKLKQTEATLDVLKEYEKDYDNFMDHFFEKGMVEPGTEAEKAERLALDKEIESKLKGSFKSYMKALAKQSDDIILDDSIDIAFNDVLDHYKLGREAGKLADAVNALNDPAGFIDHVAKTYDWMYEMWNNREDYIQENISKQLDILKSNQLLNDMAAIGVYVDLDEFADYQETGVVPTEFFDAINKRVIKRGSPIYDQVANRFMELSEFKKVIKESKPVTKNKNDELAKLDAEEAEEISNLPKVPTRIVVRTLDEKDYSAFGVKFITDELTEGQYIDATYKEGGLKLTTMFFKDQDGILRQGSAQGEVVDLESDTRYISGEIFEIINRPTDADIAEVRKKYDALRAELLERLNKYGASASTEAMAKSVEEVKAMLLSDDEYTATRRNYIIKGKAYERMTNRIRQNHNSYNYNDKNIIEDAYDETIGDGPLTEESIKAFISKLKSEEPGGFEDYTYTELEEELKSLMEEPLTETAPTKDIEAKKADIEKRRQETLNNIEFVAADFDHYIVPSLFGDKKFTFEEQAKEAINAKYDAELAALEQPVTNQAEIKTKEAEIKELERQKSELLNAQPTQTTSGKTYQDLLNEKWPDTSGYLTNPIGEGKFMKEAGKFVSGRDIFEIRPIGNGQFEYRVVNNKASQNKALASYTRYVKPVSKELNGIDGADTIVTVKPGILRKEGDGFIVEKEAQVFYANSSTINNKVGTTTAASVKVDTTEIDSKIAKAKEELDALEQTPSEDIKAKRADIEKERQKALDNLLFYNKPESIGDFLWSDSKGSIDFFKSPLTKNEYQERLNYALQKAQKELNNEIENPNNYFNNQPLYQNKIDILNDIIQKFNDINAKYDALKQAPVRPVQKVSKPTEAKTPRSVQKELDALNDKIDKLNEQIYDAEDAGNQLRADNLKMRRQELYDLLRETAERGKEAVPEIRSDLKNYVVNYAIENTYETAKANGIYLDNQFKAVFDPTSAGPVFDSKYISEEAYNDLFGEDGYITNIKKRADAGEFYIFSTDLIVYTDKAKDADGNPLPPVAGEIDFIFVDREGRKFIVDLKSGKVGKWLNYNDFGSKSYDKKIDNTLQQVGYANLSQLASGDEFQIAIWPVELNYEKTGYINRAGKPSNPNLMLNQKPIGDPKSEPFIINLDKNVKFKMINPEGDGSDVYMTAMEYMEQYVTGPVAPSTKAKAKPKGQAIPQDESSIVDAITNEIQNGNVIKAGMDANMAKTQGTISDASYKYIMGLINEKMNTSLMESAVLAAPGQQFITINDIFAEKFDGIVSVETKVNAGEIVTVESVDEANEEIILNSSNGDRFTVKFNEMNDYIVSPEQLDDKSAPAAPKYEPTQTEIDFTTESMVNVDEFLENSNLRNQATNEADNQSSDEIDNDLFSNLKC